MHYGSPLHGPGNPIPLSVSFQLPPPISEQRKVTENLENLVLHSLPLNQLPPLKLSAAQVPA